MKRFEQKIKSKIKDINKKTGIPINQLLNTLVLERFLVRVSLSQYKEKLIFKGGLCLARLLPLNRETKDIDFLMREIQTNKESIKKVFEEISETSLNDGFKFSKVDVKELLGDHKKYPGYRVSITATCGQINHKIGIDIGLGDIVIPRLLEVELMRDEEPIFEDSIELTSYSTEYIFSEKLETIIFLGEASSRMKDFYDTYALVEAGKLNIERLKIAIKETFENRNTNYNLIPITPDYIDALAPSWIAFLKKNILIKNKLELKEVILVINKFLSVISE